MFKKRSHDEKINSGNFCCSCISTCLLYTSVRDELLGEGKRSTDDRKNVPYSVFMTPPLSRVGMTEEQARESGADIQVVTLPVAAIPRARVMNDTRGVLKAVSYTHLDVYKRQDY